MLARIQTQASKPVSLTTTLYGPTLGTPQPPGGRWRFSWEGRSLYPPLTAESQRPGRHGAPRALLGLSMLLAPSHPAASYPPFMSKVEPAQFHLNGFCCWLRQHVLRGVGPCPVLACSPTRGSAPQTRQLGGVPWSSWVITSWGWQGRAWGLCLRLVLPGILRVWGCKGRGF